MKKLNDNICVVCGNKEWLNILSANEKQSLTTACVVVDEPIGKAQCKKCGLVQRINEEFMGNARYYEEQYEGYYSRPGADKFHAIRYNSMIDWIAGAIEPFTPQNILDVGCGQGGAMACLKEKFQNSNISGLEPSLDNAKFAKNLGFDVFENRLGENTKLNNQFDLIVSIYVAQHVIDPVDFFKGIKKILMQKGLAAIVIPKSEIPNIELLWSDQNFSFCAEHLVYLVKKAGLNFVSLHDSPESISPSWLIILSKEINADTKKLQERSLDIPKIDFDSLYKKRYHYMDSFKKLDDFLCNKTKIFDRVINFGASFWTSILAVYCPNYWQKVDFCTADNASGNIMGKKVISTEQANLTTNDLLVLGVQTNAQLKLFERFRNESITSVIWCNFIES